MSALYSPWLIRFTWFVAIMFGLLVVANLAAGDWSDAFDLSGSAGAFAWIALLLSEVNRERRARRNLASLLGREVNR